MISSPVQPGFADFRELLSNPNAQSVGLYGEQIAADLLRKAGYHVSFAHEGEQRGDLRVIDPLTGLVIAVEVKTARRGNDGRWSFCLRRKSRSGATHRTNVNHSDVVILLAALKTGGVVPFVIPSDKLRRITTIKISSHPATYKGRYAVWRQRPHNLSLEVRS